MPWGHTGFQDNLITCLGGLFKIEDPLFNAHARVAELVDARDLKSLGVNLCTSSILVPGTNKNKELANIGWLPFL